MRKFILAAAATATLGAMSVTADAMPINGAAAPGVAPTANVEKTVVIVTRRPARRVCRTVVTLGRRVTRCR